MIRPQPLSNPWRNSTKLGDRSYRINLQSLAFVPKVGWQVTIAPRIGATNEPMPSWYRGAFVIANSEDVTVHRVNIYGQPSSQSFVRKRRARKT